MRTSARSFSEVVRGRELRLDWRVHSELAGSLGIVHGLREPGHAHHRLSRVTLGDGLRGECAESEDQGCPRPSATDRLRDDFEFRTIGIDRAGIEEVAAFHSPAEPMCWYMPFNRPFGLDYTRNSRALLSTRTSRSTGACGEVGTGAGQTLSSMWMSDTSHRSLKGRLPVGTIQSWRVRMTL